MLNQHFTLPCSSHSHDVAAPLTPVNQEVAGYINYSSAFIPYLQWKIVSYIYHAHIIIIWFEIFENTCKRFFWIFIRTTDKLDTCKVFEVHMLFSAQSVVGLEEGDPIYWEPGKLKLKLHHIFSKQALAVSQFVLNNFRMQ